jgi:hypothetical protein
MRVDAHKTAQPDEPFVNGAEAPAASAAALIALGPVSEALRPFVNGLDRELAAMRAETPSRPDEASEADGPEPSAPRSRVDGSHVASPAPEDITRFQTNLDAVAALPPLKAPALAIPPESLAAPDWSSGFSAVASSDVPPTASDVNTQDERPDGLDRFAATAPAWNPPSALESGSGADTPAAAAAAPIVEKGRAGAVVADTTQVARLLIGLATRGQVPAVAVPAVLLGSPGAAAPREVVSGSETSEVRGATAGFDAPPPLDAFGGWHTPAVMKEPGTPRVPASGMVTREGGTGDAAVSELAARLLQAVERLEQAAVRMTSPAQGAISAPARRAFRGRVGD